MILEIVLVVVNVVLTAIFAKVTAAALHIRSSCSRCCDFELDNNVDE